MGIDGAKSYPLQDSSVLVAGASGGIGSALCLELADRGAVVTLAGRDHGRLDAVAIPGRRHVADLRTPEGCDEVVAAAINHAGRLDVVINAVGVVAFGPIVDLSIDVMEELFLTNTFVPIMLSKAALGVLSPGGAMVNISGVVAEQNLPGMAAYGASKAAIRSFDEAFGREARRSKIRVVDVRPPHTETGLAGRSIAGQAPPMPTGLTPSHVAGVICDALEQGCSDVPSSEF